MATQEDTTEQIRDHINALMEQISDHINALIEDGYSVYDIAEIMERSVDWVHEHRG